MTTERAMTPTESDVTTVEQRLTALWSDLTPQQQAVLDTIIGASLTIAGSEDASGYTDMLSNPWLAMQMVNARHAELERDFRSANTTAGSTAPRGRRFDLGPVLDWFRRAPAPQTRPRGGATV